MEIWVTALAIEVEAALVVDAAAIVVIVEPEGTVDPGGEVRVVAEGGEVAVDPLTSVEVDDEDVKPEFAVAELVEVPGSWVELVSC